MRAKGQLKSKGEFDSGFERDVLAHLEEAGAQVSKNPVSNAGKHFSYQRPPQKYYPDYVLGNGVCLEIKGFWDDEDRMKLKCVKAAYPDADIRILFNNPRSKIRKGAKTTYGEWCEKHGIPYAKGPTVPPEWLE
ncbi:hypothetical protein [Acetobacter sp. UBA5411]|nr:MULTISPECIES: hypothetical protein [Acetobacteraceae]